VSHPDPSCKATAAGAVERWRLSCLTPRSNAAAAVKGRQLSNLTSSFKAAELQRVSNLTFSCNAASAKTTANR
jgi:hypothetical protein